MSKFIIACGHTASGNTGCGAVDHLDESNCTREIAPLVVKYLEASGQETALLRVDKGNAYNCEDCYTRASQANSIGGEWYVEIHLNSGKEHTGDGAEVCVSSSSTEVRSMAARVASKLASTLGIDNRGVKDENLIVLKRTSMKAILIECMFVDCKDPSIYNADTIAKAIAEGLLNADISNEWKQGWNSKGNRWWYSPDPTNKTYYKSEWKLIDGNWYLFDSDGWCVTGWHFYENKWYYLDSESCKMVIEWYYIDNNWYYFDESGAMVTGWMQDNGKDYCFYSSGEMVRNCDLYGYRFTPSGVATKLEV